MGSEEFESIEAFRRSLDRLAAEMVIQAKPAGIDLTKEDAWGIIQDAFKSAQKRVVEAIFMAIFTRIKKEDEDEPPSPI